MQQFFDWERRHVHTVHHETEMEAALEAKKRVTESMSAVWNLLVQIFPEGLTDYELRDELGMYSAQRRRTDLLHVGMVEDSGARRPGPTGKNCIVWRARCEGEN